MAPVYTMEERARARYVFRQLDSLEAQARQAAERGLILPDNVEQQMQTLKLPGDMSQRAQALSQLSQSVKDKHLERLYPLARDDFNAFCEVMNPEEPPESKWHIWLTEKLQEIESNPDLSRLILNVPPGHAKPLSVDTPVLMADGSWKRLGDVKVGDKVISHKGIARTVTAYHDQGVLPMVKITTKSGRTIDSALDHPFLTKRDPDEWTEAEKLRPGTDLYVVAGRAHDNSGRYKSDPFAIALSAWWCAYGTTSWGKQKSSTAEKRILNPILWVPVKRAAPLLALFDDSGRAYSKAPIRGPDGGIAFRIPPTKNRDLIDLIGLTVQANDRRVPEFVMAATRGDIVSWLSIFLSERAEVPQRYSKATLVCYARSLAFLLDVQHLLARVGVNAAVYPPDPLWGGRPTLEINHKGIAAMFAAGIKFNGYRAPFVNAVKKDPLESKQGLALNVIDPVLRTDTIEPGACACLTVEEDHSFVAAGIAVRNSTYASRLYVVWRMGRNPDLQVIGGGHGQTFVENEFSSKNRTLIGSPQYQKVFPGVLIDPTMRAKGQWRIAGRKGQYVAKGVGQGVHGFRANFIVVDDPYSKIEDAESATIREKVNTWFLTDINSRLLPGGKIFVIMTRFHEEDLTGKLTELNKSFPPDKQYLIIAAPAVCFDEENDVIGRQVGEVLWDFYPISEFLDKKISLKFQRFNLLYQQSADAASEESIASHFNYYEVLPHRTESALSEAREAGSIDKETGGVIVDRQKYFRRVTLSVDTATKDNERADFTVMQVWGQSADGEKHYLMDQKRLKCEYPELQRDIERMARKWQTDTIIVEDKGNGTSYIQNRGGSDYQARKAPCPVVGISVDSRQGKAVRFDDVTPMIEEGSVYLPTHADWVGLFIREVSQFPEGNHDDQVDAMSQYLRWIRTKRTRFGTKKAVQG